MVELYVWVYVFQYKDTPSEVLYTVYRKVPDLMWALPPWFMRMVETDVLAHTTVAGQDWFKWSA